MIPVSLSVKNFMSYGSEEAVLPLEGIHVACLSGDNGNGKSALLDAMTWALWGKTRASAVKSVSDDDLIRVGADEMEVRFEFDLDSERYRAVRKRRRGRPGGEWSLARRSADGPFVPLGGGGHRDTERHIVQLLSMEYETFINSAYLQQGRADEFTRQTPDNRKRILGEVLNLDRYDRLEARSRDLYKERRELAEDLERQVRLLDAELAGRPEYEAKLQAAGAERETVEGTLAAAGAAAAAIRKQREELDTIAARRADIEVGCGRLEAEIAQRVKERTSRDERLRALQSVLDQRDAILHDYRTLQETRERREKIEPDVEAFNRASADLQTATAAIELERARLEGQLNGYRSASARADQARAELARVDSELTDIAGRLGSEPDIHAALATAQKGAQDAQDAFSELRARNDRLKREIEELVDVLDILGRPHASCPVCESDLNAEKQATVVVKQKQRRERLEAEVETLRRQGVELKREVTAALGQVTELDRRRAQVADLRGRHTLLSERKTALCAEIEAGTAGRKSAEEFGRRLATQDFAAPQRARQQKLERDIKRLGLVKAEFELLTGRLRSLEPATRRYHDLQHAEGGWERERAEKAELDRLVEVREAELRQERARLLGLDSELAGYSSVRRQEQEAETELQQLQRDLNACLVMEETTRAALARCDRAAADRHERLTAFRSADAERKIYQELAAAFGKKGVQALIIENAIPELEDEANRLLCQMTESGMQVRFATRRAAKSSKDEIETLDIVITDDAGTRPYELYSGGEAFRINLAVRIALSRLLSRRSGARLQTLILDEGFGTQDGKGREKLVEVIEAIKDDFEKILVITHVEELKDAFAQRIEIVKGVSGSRIHLL